MATFTRYLQGGTPTEIASTDLLQFSGGTFGSSIEVNDYNDGTHVETDAQADKSASNTPNNVKFIASGTADWGDGTENLDQMTNGEATLNIDFAHGEAVALSDAKIWAFNGSNPATAPSGVDVRLAEVGDSTWTEAEGESNALDLGDKGSPATSHDYYIAVSMSPTSVGSKSGALRLSLIYQ